MGQKVNPIGLRLGVNRTWDSRWYAEGDEYGRLLHEDIKVRDYLKAQLKQAGVAKIVIERPHKKCRVTVHSARPGIIIGKKGADIEKLRRKLSQMTWEQVYRDAGLNWEAISSRVGPGGARLYSLRMGKGFRAVGFRQEKTTIDQHRWFSRGRVHHNSGSGEATQPSILAGRAPGASAPICASMIQSSGVSKSAASFAIRAPVARSGSRITGRHWPPRSRPAG